MIKFTNVGKTYDNGTKALSNIDLTIDNGEFITIIGLSGAGKSTILRTINRMHEITEGVIEMDEVDIATYKGKELRNYRSHIGMVFQSFNLVNRATAINNVLTSKAAKMSTLATLFGRYSQEDKIHALECLDKVGLFDKAYTRVDQLSGGQRQRVALARTLAQEPKIILADEPVASLDPVTAKDIMDDFRRINKEFGITVFANMHHVDVALEYATRVIGIKAGEIVFDGKPEEVTEDVLEKIYGRKLTSDELLED
ncbi:phosphonate ABC transporter ATP-binding protein [Mollicutes bacterium LVI A0039]|nr:phosphonate ABC transporter ATP-binding protein [Mollicutes bacterium LVI A0039]